MSISLAGSPDERLARAMLSLDGLSCGDAFGERFFALPYAEGRALLDTRTPPGGQWPVTDDTMMAVSIVDTLRLHGRIEEDFLASHFARLYDPGRGYGPATEQLLLRVAAGHRWQEESASLFNGRGSFGNGSAMRVAPLGAYFADDLGQVIENARRSAIITHAHSEAAAGAVAIAIAAALAWQWREKPFASSDFLNAVRETVPASEVHDGIAAARRLASDAKVIDAVTALGNGSRGSAMDTVPFVLWCAAGFMNDYEDALWHAVSALGDQDTICAMVGGIVAMYVGEAGVPAKWRTRREPILPLFAQE